MEVKYTVRNPQTPKFSSVVFSVKTIVAFGVFLRVLTLLLLPNTPSSLAPDEGTYARLVLWLTSGNSALSFPEFGDGLFRSGRILILPSMALNYMGLSSLDAVRVISLTFSIFNIFLFYIFLNSLSQEMKHSLLKRIVLAIYVFLPSHFIWGTLGLRESINEFGLLVVFYFLRKILTEPNREKFSHIFFLTLGLVITFNIRPQIGLIVSSVVILALVLNFWKQPLMIFLIFLFPIMNLLANSVPLGLPKVVGNLTSNVTSSPTDVLDFIQDKRDGNQQFANSKIVVSDCNKEQTRFTNLTCEITRMPSAIIQVTFRPLPIYDRSSSAQIGAGIENLFWILMYVFIMLRLKPLLRKSHLSFEIPAALFVLLFTIAAAVYEGNVGTAFRHKGLLLPLVLLIATSLYIERSFQMPRLVSSKVMKKKNSSGEL
jgi:hypothetical protein